MSTLIMLVSLLVSGHENFWKKKYSAKHTIRGS